MIKKLLILIVLAGIAAAIGGGIWLRGRVTAPYRGYTGEEQFVEIPPGSGTKTIGDRLIAAGVVSDELTFRAAVWLSGQATKLKAGEYRFAQPMSAAQVIDKIVRGDVHFVSITFPEGLTIAEMARIYESEGFGTAAAFLEAAKNAARIRALDRAATDLEGYLFPETYALPRKASAGELVNAMVDRFLEVFNEDLRKAAEARGFSVRQAVALASLVEKETAKAEERPLVSAVYNNRLRIGMALQADPTVIYAMQLAGTYRGNLTRDDLSLDSPYNTYRYPGLPPGPIAAPGKGSLEAAVKPADADFLYFVSRNDGSHEFARTLAEHNRNVQKYQVQYFRDRRAAARAGGAKD